MKRRRLGKSGLVVSEIGMGTMTFGSQTEEKEAHRILDLAYDHGIDFYDVAEMYPVPPKEETFGITESIIGRWLKQKPRNSILLATKITGPAHGWFQAPVRHGHTALDRHQIVRALEDSLRRLQTDYIDLYQTHWPDHGMPPEETLAALADLIQAGKIRVIGSSNETCWGLMKNLWAADLHQLPRMETVQNNFSLINRRCLSELAQVCRQESVSLIPYSPLGGGVLSGKYLQDQFPPNARFSDYIQFGGERQKKMVARFVNPRTLSTTQQYQEIANQLGIPLPTLAVAWSKQHDFVASTLIGATTAEQMPPLLQASDCILPDDVLLKLDQIELETPNAMGEDGLRRL